MRKFVVLTPTFVPCRWDETGRTVTNNEVRFLRRGVVYATDVPSAMAQAKATGLSQMPILLEVEH